MAYFDLAFIDKLNSLSIETVAVKLGMNVSKHKSLCPWHNDHNPSLRFSINPQKNYCHCFVCGNSGGPISLTMQVEKCGFQEACMILAKEFSIPLPNKQKNTIKRKKKVEVVIIEEDQQGKEADREVLNWVIQHTRITKGAVDFLENQRRIKKEIYEPLNIRGIDNEAAMIQNLLEEFGAKRLLDGNIIEKGYYGYLLAWNVPCLLFPYYDIDGRLINIQSRYLGKIVEGKPPRFKFVKDVRTSIFNIGALNQIKPFSPVLITEGVTDCLAALSCGITAVAVPGSSAFKPEYANVLQNFRLFICPDDDPAGNHLLQDIQNKMGERCCPLRELHLDDGSNDLGDYYAKHATLRFT
jgi:DNA primase (bacterial type)